MICFLKGTLEVINGDLIEIDVNGVGYQVLMDTKTQVLLPPLAAYVKVLIHQITKDDGTILYGFLTEATRMWFVEFVKISGISGKTAINILSHLTVEDITFLVQKKQASGFTAVSGIGSKLATRIINEIKDISGAVSTLQILASNVSKPVIIAQDAISALINLGVQKVTAAKCVYQILDNHTDISLEELIKKAISEAHK